MENQSSLRNFVAADLPLPRTFEAQHLRIGLGQVFDTHTRRNPFTPAPKTGWFQMAAHELFHFALRQTELQLDGIKRRAILPGHFNNAINTQWIRGTGRNFSYGSHFKNLQSYTMQRNTAKANTGTTQTSNESGSTCFQSHLFKLQDITYRHFKYMALQTICG